MRPLLGCFAVCAIMLAVPVQGQEDNTFFNGKDLSNFEGLTQYWSVKDGAIVGSTEPDGLKFNTFLCSKKPYKDFELSFKVRLKGKGPNSGVQIRSELVDKKNFAVWGPQCDMGEGWWGSLFGEHFGGEKKGDHRMLKAADKEAVGKVLKKEDFNDYSIRAAGKRVTIKVNGVTTVDEEFPILPESGIIAFQIHGGGPMEVTFKDVRFKEIK
jgi:hypothetical protein